LLAVHFSERNNKLPGNLWLQPYKRNAAKADSFLITFANPSAKADGN